MLVTMGMASIVGLGVYNMINELVKSENDLQGKLQLIFKRSDICVETKEKIDKRKKLYPKFIRMLYKNEKGATSRAFYYSIPAGMDKFDIVNKLDKIRDGLGTEIIFDWVAEDRDELYKEYKIKNADFCITVLKGFLPKRIDFDMDFILKMIEHDYDQLVIPIGNSRAGFETINLSSESSHSMIVAGTAGSGKSTLLRLILLALHIGYTPEEVQLWLMDLKENVEFDVVENSYLIKEKVGSPWKAGEFLVKLLTYTQNKYSIIKSARCTDIGQYNRKVKKYPELGLKQLPRDVVFIDEYAMLDPNAADDMEEQKYFKKCRMIVKQIVQIARASGVHTILSTQRPSHEIIDGTMKNNFSITVGFRVKNAQSSGVVMDDMSNKSLMYIDPEKPGRCIMRGVKRDLAIQVPYLDSELARELFAPYQTTTINITPTQEQYEKSTHQGQRIEIGGKKEKKQTLMKKDKNKKVG